MLFDIFDNPIPDPLAGDPELIERFAHNYQVTSEALRDAAKELHALANESITISLAIDEVRERADESYADTIKVADRYAGAAATYHSYKSALAAAQQLANGARTQIMHNNDNARYWRRHQKELQLEILTDPSKAPDLVIANQKVTHYNTEYHQALHQYNTAVDDKHRAVLAAIHGLDDAAHSAGLDDNFFEAIAGAGEVLYDLAQKYLTPILQKLRAVLEIIKSIVDIISLIVSIAAIFLPFLAPLAAALAIASIALSAAIFLCSLALFALGKESIGRVLGDLINVAASVITAKLGGALKPGALSGLGATASAAAWKTAAHEATQMTVKEVAAATGEAAVDYGKDVLVEVPAELLNFGAEQIDVDGQGGGAAWGDVSAPSSDEVGSKLGEIGLGVLTGGVSSAIGDFGDAVGEIGGAFTTDINNVMAFAGVPSE